MHLLIVLISVFPLSVVAIDDTPGGNLTLEFDYIPGNCTDVSPHLLSCDKKTYEGRWYGKFVAYSVDFANSMSCYVWDTFFSDDKWSYHNFLYTLFDGVPLTMVTSSTLIPGKPGEHILLAGPAYNDSSIVSCLYYMDTEMFIFWDQLCFNDGSKHTRNAVVGFRDLSIVRSKKPQLDRIMKILEKTAGGPIPLRSIRHSKRCKYPPKMKNPYN